MPPCRVVLLEEAVADLERLARSGIHLRFLKPVEIERDDQTGQPLGKGLTGWRKVIVGDRTWRIVFQSREGVAVVVAIGDRADEAVYREASQRIESVTRAGPGLRTLSEALLDCIERSRSGRKHR